MRVLHRPSFDDWSGRTQDVAAEALQPSHHCDHVIGSCPEFVGAWLIKEGRIRRSAIGVACQNVPLHPRVVRFHQLPRDRGVLIAELLPNSPASRAGLREGDIIVGFRGQAVATIDDLHKKLVAEVIGEPSPVMVLRQTEKIFAIVIPEESKNLAEDAR